MNVPFLDLKAHHAPLIDQFDRAIREVIESSAFAGGPFVERFEKEFAAYCGSKYAIGVGNGTATHRARFQSQRIWPRNFFLCRCFLN
jgi:dTDP-4-amino-4,6-dideoxygalactose transaminase